MFAAYSSQQVTIPALTPCCIAGCPYFQHLPDKSQQLEVLEAEAGTSLHQYVQAWLECLMDEMWGGVHGSLGPKSHTDAGSRAAGTGGLDDIAEGAGGRCGSDEALAACTCAAATLPAWWCLVLLVDT